MSKVAVPEKDADDSFYGVNPGSWGMLKRKSIDWYYCRDVFDDEPLRLKEFCFWAAQRNTKSATKDAKLIIKFMAAVQKRLKLSRKDRLKINLTNRPGVLHIELSKWWQNRARRAMLTCLLRAGMEYDGHFWKTLGKQEYLQSTWPAVQRFFAGYTRFAKKRFHGWQDTFAYWAMSDDDLRLVLSEEQIQDVKMGLVVEESKVMEKFANKVLKK